MPTELRWIVSTTASALHAAAAMLAGKPLVDQRLSEALAGEVDGLRQELAASGIEPDALCELLIPLSVQFDTSKKLVEVALSRLLGPAQVDPGAVAQLARWLDRLRVAFDAANPRALDELELRAEPLRGQWEARGPGLLAGVRRLTEADLIVEQANVILMQPVLGGGGCSYWLSNSVSIEAVLTNPLADLPEVARLGWLVSQLSLDRPTFQGRLDRDQLAVVGPLAMIPPILSAAADVELARDDLPTLARALDNWLPGAVGAERLDEWWRTYQSSRPAWEVALGALARILEEL